MQRVHADARRLSNPLHGLAVIETHGASRVRPIWAPYR